MARQYDLVIVGAGTAAMTAASRVRSQGWSVAVIDFRPFGGTCALRGCDPKKMLIAATSVVDHVHRMRGHGTAGDVHIEWSKLMAFKRTFTDPVPEMQEHNYQAKGVDTLHGEARFTGPQTIEVNGEALEGRYVLLATGAEPVKLGIPGEEHLMTNEGFLALEALPAHIVFVGGGYIAAEFAHIAALSGAKVTILQHADRMLTTFDKDLVGWLMKKFDSLGIDVQTGTAVQSIEKLGSGYRVRSSRDGEKHSVDADLVVHAAGRKPSFSRLDLEAAGVEMEAGRLKLNEFLQSVSNPAIYAAGDAAQVGPPLTPVSSHDAGVVATNLLKGNTRQPDYLGIPSVAFTLPPIASVGLSEEAARDQGLRLRVQSKHASNWYTSRQAAEPVYGFKVIVDESSDKVLGAHLVGPHSDDVINLFALAIRHGITATALKQTMFAYPTGASDISYML
jgi:glutathione reductase (NADPH)